MVSSIGSSVSLPGLYSDGVSAASIQSQITRFKQELADCVNCPSSKTQEGKAKIQELSNKISTAETQLQDISVSKTDNQIEKLHEANDNNYAERVEELKQIQNTNTYKGINEPSNLTSFRLGINLDIYT